MTEEREVEWEEEIPADPPEADSVTPEVKDQPMGPPADLDDDEAPLPGVPEKEPPASE
jgi:hypothetical protein